MRCMACGAEMILMNVVRDDGSPRLRAPYFRVFGMPGPRTALGIHETWSRERHSAYARAGGATLRACIKSAG